MASLAEYGANPNAGVDPNDDHGWGGHAWPQGVPDNLLGVATYRTRHGDVVRVTVREELVPLFELMHEITDLLGYQVHTFNPDGSGEFWGPWAYENRPISGTNTPSNHSRGKANDINSPMNPQSFTFTSTWPPKVIAAWEQCGFFWGGRYRAPTKFDTMHVEYAFSPADVPRHVDRATTMVRALRSGNRLPGFRGSTSRRVPSSTAARNPTGTTEDDMGLLVKDPATGWVYAVAPGYFQALDADKQKDALASGLFREGPQWNAVQLIQRRRVALGDWSDGADARAIAAGKGIMVPDRHARKGFRFA